MREMRVVVANEPRAYRDVIALALQSFRPNADISVVDPEDLDAEVARRLPDLVLCSQPRDILISSSSWIILHYGGENRAVINVGGRRSIVPEIDFDGILTVYDEVTRLDHGG